MKGSGPAAEYADPIELRLKDGSPFETYGNPAPMLADWDGDGRLDLIVNGINADWMRNLGIENGVTRFADPIPLDAHVLANHSTSPCPCDFDDNGKKELLIGAEDGYFYMLKSP